MTPRRSYEDAVDAVRAGAIDLILKAPESVVYLKDRVIEGTEESSGFFPATSSTGAAKPVLGLHTL